MLPTSTDVTFLVKAQVPAGIEAIVVLATESAETPVVSTLPPADQTAVTRLLTGKIVRGKSREVGFDVVELSPGKFRRVYVVGLGKPAKVTSESFRQSAGAAVKALRKHRLSRAVFVVSATGSVNAAAAAEAIVTGALLAAFDYEEYKGTARKKDPEDQAVRKLELTALPADQSADLKTIRAAVDRGRIIADGQNFARTIASRPGNDITPPTLADVSRQLAKEVGLTIQVFDEKQLAKLGMGGILAVGAGSIASPPRLIILEHKPKAAAGATKRKIKGKAASAPLLVIGKAITFDTGGISIKPADRMGRMIFDKCGGMAVLGLMYAVAKLALPIHVVGILSSAENALSEKAYRPGDILRMYNGVTVEVTNTDAEGRLVLGDALAWGIETYEPAAVVDLATLTGGVITALGKTMAGVMSNSDGLVKELTEAGETVGEKMWRLPLGEDQRDYIRSEPADIMNSAGREGHPLQGGAFLSFFVPTDGSVPWAHLDIAGTADTEKELPYYAKGATGWGVQTLVEWVSRRAKAP